MRCDNAPAPWSSEDTGDSLRLEVPEVAQQEIDGAAGGKVGCFRLWVDPTAAGARPLRARGALEGGCAGGVEKLCACSDPSPALRRPTVAKTVAHHSQNTAAAAAAQVHAMGDSPFWNFDPVTSEWGWAKPPPPSQKSGEKGDTVKKLRKKVGRGPGRRRLG